MDATNYGLSDAGLANTIPCMAKRTKKSATDRHRGKLIGVRLPAPIETAIRERAVSNRRTLTAEFVIALEQYLGVKVEDVPAVPAAKPASKKRTKPAE